MSSAKRRAQAKQNEKPVDSGYPFDTGDWDKWSNRKRLDWMTNFRDRIRDNFKEKFGFTDADVARMSDDVAALQRIVEIEESDPERAPDWAVKPWQEKVLLKRHWLDDLAANDYENARLLGHNAEAIENLRDALNKYEREMTDWQHRQDAQKALDGGAVRAFMLNNQIDDTKLREAFASGDEEAVNREFRAWVAKLEEAADKDPVFAKWFEEFRDDQEKLLRWDDTIGDEE